METATILVLSTAHLPPRKVRRFGFRSAPHAYGWIVFLGAPGEREPTARDRKILNQLNSREV